ncbi:MAG: Acyl-CoA synthetase (AMP-forming)/AMP-acid ligase [Roseomonas sp.]|nr:Acyl-CoA synthetase (AMP-forming)/AMP-acid ligase [Roseomonas sp.]
MPNQTKARTLAAVLDEWAALDPTRPAIFHEDRVLSYGALREETLAAAATLLARGVRPGDRIGMLLGNVPEWVVLALAADRVGAVMVPLSTWYKETEIAWTMAHCGISLLVSATRFLRTDYAAIIAGLVPEVRGGGRNIRNPRFPSLRHVMLLESEAASWDDFLAEGRGHEAALPRDLPADRNAFIIYTSGSTAAPKGVVLNQDSLVANGWQLGARRGIGPQDRVWIGTPLFYALGAANALPASLTHGAAIVLQGWFEPGRAMDTIERTCATVYYATGNMTIGMLGHPEYRKARLGSLVKGNAGLGAEYKRLTLVELGIKEAVPAYGMTETYGNVTVGRTDDPIELKLRSDGAPVPGMELRIVDPDTGAPVPTGGKGLVLVRGHITPGYYGNPPEAMAAFRADGWFDTGDIGSLDTEGNFTFEARLKEVIKSGGINISPVEVEQLIASHPDVRDAYVVGVTSPKLGQLIVAFVNPCNPVSEAAIRDFMRERAASYKAPHHVLFRKEEQLPRLSSGKVSKARLIEDARIALGLAEAAP